MPNEFNGRRVFPTVAVGFKNSMALGDIKVAVDAVLVGASRAYILSLGDQRQASRRFSTTGNDDCHVILRGGREPNYDEASVQAGCDLLATAKLPSRLMVDLSHANSSKDHERQKIAGEAVAAQVKSPHQNVLGVMIESHLVAGKQHT